MHAAISFQQVSLSLHDTPILHNITGHFPKGQITTLVGPSGAGKTTVLKLCNALLSPTTGTILYNEQPLHVYEPTELRQSIGIALQAAPMIDGTVFDNLALPYRLQSKTLSKQAASEALEVVGLRQELLHTPARKLSGGQRQKVSIARTLMNDADILLLDEITSALDPHAVAEIESLVLSMKARGVTVIWITHHLEQAKRIGDYMWMMQHGQLIESGPCHLLEHSSHEVVQQFMRGELK